MMRRFDLIFSFSCMYAFHFVAAPNSKTMMLIAVKGSRPFLDPRAKFFDKKNMC
jgi:hypothetical protein